MATLAPTVAPTRAAPALSLDGRLALASLAMDDRLATASMAISVTLAPIEIPEPEILTAPMPAAAPQPATVREVFREAGRLITAHGWIRRYVGNAQTGYCLIGAIRAAAGGNRLLEDAAEAKMLDRIRRHFPDTPSVGAWNDGQSGPGLVLRMLG